VPDGSGENRAELDLVVHYSVTRVLAESSTLAQAARGILEAICQTLDFEVGQIWTVDRTGDALHLIECWHAPRPELAHFVAETGHMTFPPEVGLPGRVWASQEPTWIADLMEDPGFTRKQAARRARLHTALAFPIVQGGRATGVIEFFSAQVRSPDQHLLQLMAATGAQIGQFMGRKETEQLVVDSEAEKSAIIASALDCIITIDQRGRIVEFNPAAERTFGYSRRDAIGAPMAELIIPQHLQEAHAAGFARYRATGEENILGRRLEMTAMRANGTEFPVELTVTALEVPGKPTLFTGFVRDISERRRAEEELRRTQQLNQMVLDNSQDLISLVDPQGVYQYVSPSCEQILGYRPEELIGHNATDVVHPDDLVTLSSAIGEAIDSGAVSVPEIRVRHKDGHYLLVEGTGTIIRDPEGRPQMILASSRDISTRRRAELDQIQLAAIVESSSDAIISTDLEGRIVSWNAGAHRVYGYRPEEAIGSNVSMLVPDDRSEEFAAILDRLQQGEPIESLETVRLRKNGVRVDMALNISPIRDGEGRVVFVSSIGRDISERRRAEKQIAFMAFHDKLTGLANRAKFEELMEMALARARRNDLAVAVLYLDLDNFKLVNDSLGHAAGDDVLREVAARLVSLTRETDVVARLGGDEFLLLLPDLRRSLDGPTDANADTVVMVAEAVAARINDCLKEPFVLSDTEFYVSASVGVSLFPIDAEDGRSLLKNADAAMYQSRKTGPGGYAMFPSTAHDPTSALSLATRLRKAVENEDWVLYYQPIMDLVRGEMVGVEGLLRWRDPDYGIIAPGEFLPLAEEMGLMERIGDWVMKDLFRQASQWRAQGLQLDVSFNLSPRQLWHPELVENLLARLNGSGVDPGTLVIEITEAAAMAGIDRTQRVLSHLRNEGLRFAIDDFGTGYSSLSRLRDLPVDILKIDRSFVRDVPGNQDAVTVVQAIIQLALSLGMAPLAEGIETQEQWQFLVDHGCRLGQGFYFRRPVPADQIPELCGAAAFQLDARRAG
jgi:diguanylate cyclase (GGDEF)-like protein/PAS domain S-box-containing protein